MDSAIDHCDSKVSQHEVGGMHRLTQIPTSVTLSAEQFERLYLNPMLHRQSYVSKNLGNPTPLYAFPPHTLPGLSFVY